MVLAPNDLFSWNNEYNKYIEYNVTDTFTCSSQLCTSLTLCMLASWSHEGVVFLDLLSSSHSITSSLFPYPGSTDAPCSRLGDPVPPFPRWRPHSRGPRTLPYRDPEQEHWNITNNDDCKCFFRDRLGIMYKYINSLLKVLYTSKRCTRVQIFTHCPILCLKPWKKTCH